MSEIRRLNDLLRTTFINGRVVMTAGVAALPDKRQAALLTAVREFNTFNKDNDPYGEHDMGSVEIDSTKFFWKIEYYDKDCQYGSENPADPAQTTRVLTIMRADEY
jgi:hypothetical protein